MIEHVVLFKVTPGATEEQQQRVVEELKTLKGKIPGIIDLSVGRNFSSRSQGFEIGLVVRFRDREALEAYLPHPAHRACVDTYINPIRADVIVVDYEIG